MLTVFKSNNCVAPISPYLQCHLSLDIIKRFELSIAKDAIHHCGYVTNYFCIRRDALYEVNTAIFRKIHYLSRSIIMIISSRFPEISEGKDAVVAATTRHPCEA